MKNFSITVDGSCPNSLFVPHDGFCYYANPTLRVEFDDAVALCQGYGHEFHFASILVIFRLDKDAQDVGRKCEFLSVDAKK